MNAELLKKLGRITEEEQELLRGEILNKRLYSVSNDFIIDKVKMLETGKLISVRPHTRFTDFPLHKHNYVEIIYMCGGQTEHMIGGEQPLTLRAGELLFLNQHVSHAIKRAELQDIAINFIVMPQFFDFVLDIIGSDHILGQFLLNCLRQSSGYADFLHFKVSDLKPIQNQMENFVIGMFEPDGNSRLISQVSMSLLFLLLLGHIDRLHTAGPGRASHALVLDALQSIQDRYQSVSLSAVAEKHGVSLAYVSRLVKEATGKSFKELLMEKRLSKAEQLLTGTNLPAADIITAVGYENTSYFYRLFRERFGLSPKEYRRQNKQDQTSGRPKPEQP